YGQAFSFDGVDDFVQVPSHPNINPGSGSFSVDAWIFQTGLGSDGFQSNPVVNKADGDMDNGWNLTGGAAQLGGRADFVIDQLNGPTAEVHTRDPIPLNTWVHLAGVYDTVAHELRIYVNGNKTTATGVNIGPINPVSDLLIGKFKRFSLNRDEFFSGLID